MGLREQMPAQLHLGRVHVLEVLRHDGLARVEEGVIGDEPLNLLLLLLGQVFVGGSRVRVLMPSAIAFQAHLQGDCDKPPHSPQWHRQCQPAAGHEQGAGSVQLVGR